MQREKETEFKNLRNTFETELKTKIFEAQKTIEVSKSKSSEMEIRKIQEKYEQEFKAKEDAQVQLYRNYQERDQAWQLEKQVYYFIYEYYFKKPVMVILELL